MPRQLKPIKVSADKFDDGSPLVTYLDRNTKTFFVDVLGDRVSNADASACERRARERWRELAEIPWTKIIVVDMRRSHFIDHGLSLTHSVRTIGRTPDGNWMARLGDDTDATTRYTGPTENGENQFVLPWSKQTETAIVEIEDKLVVLKDRLRALLGDERAPELLAATVPALLPAVAEQDEGDNDAV